MQPSQSFAETRASCTGDGNLFGPKDCLLAFVVNYLPFFLPSLDEGVGSIIGEKEMALEGKTSTRLAREVLEGG